MKSALNFIKKFAEQILADKARLEGLVEKENEKSVRLQKRANTAREHYGKVSVFSKPHDSDNSEDEFDSDILASSSIADHESVASEGNDDEMVEN